MIRGPSVALLVSIVGVCVAGRAFAQDNPQSMAKVMCAGDPECETLATYRLTADNLRKMFAVDGDLSRLIKARPDLERRMDELTRQIDPAGRLGKLTVSAQVHEGIPEIAAILRRHKISGHEYMFTYAVAMVTAMADATLAYGARQDKRNEIPPELMTPALKFWRSMDPPLKAEADAWTKMRGYDQPINR